MRFKTEGWARKVALPLLIISAAAWVVYVVGCRLLHNEMSRHTYTGNNTCTDHPVLHINVWIFLASGPPLYILSIIHLLTGNSVVGLATNFFTILSLVSGGAAAQWASVLVNVYPSASTITAVCLVSVGFLSITVLLWPFFITNTPECCMNLTAEDRMAFSGRHSQQPQPDGFTQQPMYFVTPTSDETKTISALQTEFVPPSNQQKKPNHDSCLK